MKAPEVSIVIVSWNVCELLLDCIKPFYNKPGIEIIVVDNNSSDDTIIKLQKNYPEIILINNKNNVGFSRANNQGFLVAKGKYTYILNPDTVTSYNSLLKLVEVLNNQSEVGGVGPKIHYGNGQLQKSCARKFPTLLSFLFINTLRINKIPGVGNRVLKILKYPYSYETSGYIECCSGAAYLVRSEILKKLEGFNVEYLHTGEDVDLMRRVVKTGYKNYFCATSTLTHFAGQSSKQANVRVQINTLYSSKTYFKNQGKIKGYLYHLLLVFFTIPKYLILAFIALFNSNDKSKTDFFNYLKIIKGIIFLKPIK